MPTTFSAALTAALRHEPGRPFVTFYDHASGERVELSVTTYANWVAKAASLLTEECDLERGDSILLDLPTHWLGTVFLGAAWSVGLQVTESAEDAAAVVCGPDSLTRWAEVSDDVAVLACSLRPMGVRFAEAVPAGVHDVGLEIWGQPDAFTAWDAPTGSDVAWQVAGVAVTQQEMCQAAAAGSLLHDGGRLLSVQNPASPPGFNTFTEPLLRNGSLVLVSHADPERLDEIATAERATARV